jgi:hypothetical protein
MFVCLTLTFESVALTLAPNLINASTSSTLLSLAALMSGRRISPTYGCTQIGHIYSHIRRAREMSAMEHRQEANKGRNIIQH